ncbi:hypothetical protein AUK40_00145 [Candidatus Wirthbacteria bacterium CG2_30_54_11]|uniref:Major facilitator superfamily (MFS) profile domain-containing protein n=1 Tax=Candidatus Wirthbacteria bacterium CG2_30_54_11 TaxID=1817892 RepID=A0A1J5J505_9BACT|nr:MAG: hypothetical protein AUK40_00145 [Candidatus Wirthbacteria bacterium CG2_30_54_11]
MEKQLSALRPPKIPPRVWYLSLVSLFNDTASEMLYPIMPIFITSVLGAPVFVIGIIEGVAEGVAALFKGVFGYWSDRLQKRKPFVVTGYGAAAVSKLLTALAYSWPLVLCARLVDRLGKGLRTGARDALLLEASDDSNRGFIFGFHRAMDSLGAVIGPLIALVLLNSFHFSIRHILFIAVIPASLSLLFFFLVKDTTRKILSNKVTLSLSIRDMPAKYKQFLLGMTIFSLGNSSDSFLILRAQSLGLSLSLVISAYMMYYLTNALMSAPAGRVADRIGPKKVLIAGLVIFTLVYTGFAVNSMPAMVWVLFAVYGLYIAFTDGVSKALIGSMTSVEKSGTAYGTFYTVTSLATLLASILGGILWSVFSPAITFAFAVICTLAALVIFTKL